MGMWGIEPWDNDAAADLIGDLMDESSLRDIWAAKLAGAIEEDEPEEIRACVWIFLQFGRTYVWPIDYIDEDLEVAITASEKLVNDPDLVDIEGMKEKLQGELKTLIERRR